MSQHQQGVLTSANKDHSAQVERETPEAFTKGDGRGNPHPLDDDGESGAERIESRKIANHVGGRPVRQLLDVRVRMLDILPGFLCSFSGAEHGPSLPSSTVVRFFAGAKKSRSFAALGRKSPRPVTPQRRGICFLWLRRSRFLSRDCGMGMTVRRISLLLVG